MFRLLLFLRGYYEVAVSGYGTERFINLCKIKGIYLWDVKNRHHKLVIKIAESDYLNLDEILYKTGVKVDILKKYGLPFLFIGKKKRIFALISILSVLVLIFVTNLFVWKINYEGYYTLSLEQLEDFLYSNHVKEGVLKSGIEYEILEEKLRKEFPVIKWCSVALTGNTLYIKIEENSLLKEETVAGMEFLYSDIVAENAGVVTDVMVRNGLSMVKIGDKVEKGQILITGAVPVYDDALEIKNMHYYDADAEVLIETQFSYVDSLDDVFLEKEYTGRSFKTSFIKVNEKEIDCFHKNNYAYYDVRSDTKQMVLFGRIKTPVYYGTKEVKEYYLSERKYTENEVLDIFNKNLSNYYISLSEKGVQIIEKDVKIEHNASEWVLNGEFVVSQKVTTKEYRNQVENFIQ